MLLDGLEEEGTAPTGASGATLSAESLAEGLFARVKQELGPRPRTPLSTYRVQLHRGFTFQQAREVVPFLARLGVSDFYASPYLKATPGSTHGYDCVDHTRLNPEVGSPEDHAALCASLREHGLGQVLDVVPNHMGIERDNRLWFDVLENGPSSVYAKYFDIDWSPVKDELHDKVLLPILGDQYGIVLERGELKLSFREGAFFIHYYDHLLPVAPRQYGRILRHGLERLEARLGTEAAPMVELLSILTAIDHLPLRTEIERARVVERHREKEVIKRRLAAVAASSEEALLYIEDNVRVFNGEPGNPRSFDLLDAVLASCSFRLAHWRVAGEEINYRRFFDINGLAAIRVEDPEVFQEAHALIFRWLREGCVTGLRIDHPDGLFDPTAYFLDLQERYFVERAHALFLQEQAGDDTRWPGVEAALRERWRAEVTENPSSPLRKALYVVVEKIQGGRERIPEAWAVHGTTGYRFANAVSGLFVHPAAETHLTETYERLTGEKGDFAELVYQKKLLIMRVSMASEINVLAHELNRISEMSRRTRDFTLNSLRRALVEFVALFPVYRTYVDGWRPGLDARDVQYVEWTIQRAKERNATTNASIFDFLRDIILGRYPEQSDERERAVMLRFAMKLQQVTGPVMAKGLEDTVFYIYNRLVSLNEVGGEPERFGVRANTFHLRNQERAEHWPASQLTSSTHDTKRSEDVRARINVVTEVPEDWRKLARRWMRLTEKFVTPLPSGPAPSPNDVYLFLQTVVGAWPMGESQSPEAMEDFHRRVREYMAKAIKEAKVRTSWTNPDGAYDDAVAGFVDACFDGDKGATFLEEVRRFKRRIERAGQHNALGQLLLKLASPGVVDTYQGCELWDLSLVDPDNRRPVDFAVRAQLLDALDARAKEDRVGLCARLVETLDDGQAKLFLLSRVLRLRQRHAELFRNGGYKALELSGPRAQAAVAFVRELEDSVILVCSPRYTLSALESSEGLAGAYENTFLDLPEAYAGMMFRDVFTGRQVRPERGSGGVVLPLAPLLSGFPVVLLERSTG
ncbi:MULTISPECIES: malto-oligosyltrehalose synthase [Myxococcus]|uniref:Malto-oligosyltrehalose synthase n=1 Tax=Myxococcus llanfairpwllgwyngyllgogerychwyrndrobwllllantysiliogogogochensis TaxID=2590453 RepID=A0A540X499_9BACT|nr:MULTISPECIES: malto-oligosyltrehalose synthase [Myxococcus]NTX04817.1 malto-oligosyltrehalose synthase [Myxococcus sp. CA040A]TQF16073.1 malto-oligosyltrehalose synthase [Myxococcus llanfairpwllgwyngyllgogerychwyrndrobwllllantysiliogogogochensis]